MIAAQDHLGIGIYTPAEAAFYARVSRQTMTRWVFGTSQRRSVIERQLPEEDEKIVTFLDLVQTLAVREIRNRHGIPLPRIREGVEEAQKRYSLEYPLACKHRIFLFSDQKRSGHGDIVIRLEGDHDDPEDRYVQLSGRSKGNLMMKPVVEMFLDDLTFDAETRLATQYRPLSEGQQTVLLDPHRRFGEPLIQPSGYTVEALWHATNTEGGIDAAAEAYGVSREEVELANKYYDMLLSRDAA